MIAPFSPTPDSLIGLFKRRGEASQFIKFMPSTGSADSSDFGCELMPDEFPVLRILASSSSNACWMTTKRLMWAALEGQQEIQLTQLDDAAPRYFDNLLVEDDALRIKTKDGHVYDIEMPDRGILNGVWGILDRYARRSQQKQMGSPISLPASSE